MPRTGRVAPGGMVHVLNRANNRGETFAADGDDLAFLRVMHDALDTKPMRVQSYCVMPNQWHLLLCVSDPFSVQPPYPVDNLRVHQHANADFSSKEIALCDLHE